MIHVSVNCQPEKKFLFVCLFSGFVVCLFFVSFRTHLFSNIYAIEFWGEK